MKQVYICEKCSEQFDNYDLCAEHERTHLELNIFPSCFGLDVYSTYSVGSVIPDTIICGTEKTVYDDNYNRIGVEVHVYGYKLVREDKALSAKLQKERDIVYAQEREESETRERNKAWMIKELEDSDVEIKSTWYHSVAKQYEEHFGHEYKAE